ncbi:MAG: methyltransferase domain-containing protein [Myxococcales bacterium]|nr:methyltransferase domain-containing protein [Myxococcales bacterium]
MASGIHGDGLGQVRALLCCPSCRHALEPRACALACTECKQRFPMDDVATELVHGPLGRPSLGSRAMQSRLLARIYDTLWRPASFGWSTGFTMPSPAIEAEWVVRDIGDAPGPWLDLSCGPGGLSRKLAELAPKRELVALDLSRAMLARARVANPGAVRIRANAERLPFVDQAFGAVISLAALDLYSEPATVVAEAARVLMPNGRLVVSGFLSPDTLFGSRALRSKLTETSGVHPLSESRLCAMVESAGLVRRAIRRFGRYVCLSAHKPTPASDRGETH